MDVVGHLLLGYLVGKASAHRLKMKMNVPLIFIISIIPDIDYLQPEFHRGITHSVFLGLVVFIPFLIIYRKKAVPYLLALLSHSLIGDLIAGPSIRPLLPINSTQIPTLFPNLNNDSLLNIVIELTLFLVSTLIMFKTRDLQSFFKNKKTNLLLVMPIATMLMSLLLVNPPVPLALWVPHIFYIALFTISILILIFKVRLFDVSRNVQQNAQTKR